MSEEAPRDLEIGFDLFNQSWVLTLARLHPAPERARRAPLRPKSQRSGAPNAKSRQSFLGAGIPPLAAHYRIAPSLLHRLFPLFWRPEGLAHTA